MLYACCSNLTTEIYVRFSSFWKASFWWEGNEFDGETLIPTCLFYLYFVSVLYVVNKGMECGFSFLRQVLVLAPLLAVRLGVPTVDSIVYSCRTAISQYTEAASERTCMPYRWYLARP